jgi:7-carboxy-7-deazaguanine synthase
MSGEAKLSVTETFLSIQGESTWAGLSCFFIRLSGCNLRCRYCDTTHAYEPGDPRTIDELVGQAQRSGAEITEITGGEPLLQAGCRDLALVLMEVTTRPVLVETNGSVDISLIPEGAIAVMDVKCPGSGQSAAMNFDNIRRLRAYDEVKFVISDRYDFEWAADIVRRHDLARRCHAVLFGVVHGELALSTLGHWIMEERLPVRVHTQLHKILGVR